jgi:predicted ferric reductase
MIAAGIGATPFISILIGFIYKLRFNEEIKQKSISFYWIQRDYEKTEFINNLLDEINVENKNNLFEINVFITSAQQRYDFRYIFILINFVVLFLLQMPWN